MLTGQFSYFVRKIPMNLWRVAFGQFWMQTQDRESKTSQASQCMPVLAMVATVHQVALILSRVNSRSASITHCQKHPRPLTVLEFASCWKYTILCVNTSSI